MPPFDLRDAAVPAVRHDLHRLLATLPTVDVDPVPLGDVRARLGERPVWDAATETLLWVDVEAGLVHRWRQGDPTRALDPWQADSPVGIAWPTDSGGVLVAAASGLRLLGGDHDLSVPGTLDGGPHDPAATLAAAHSATPATGHTATRAAAHTATPAAAHTDPCARVVWQHAAPAPGHRWNDGATDPAGRLWLVAMSIEDATAPGTVHRVTATADDVVLTEVTCGNGIQFSPDGRWLYLTDSVRRILYRLPFDPETGEPGTPEPLFATAQDGPIPDGTTVDADGALWVPYWAAGAVLRLDPDGRPVDWFALPVPLVTCLGVGPDGNGWASTAGNPHPRLGDPQGAADGGAVFRVRLPDGVRAGAITPVRGL